MDGNLKHAWSFIVDEFKKMFKCRCKTIENIPLVNEKRPCNHQRVAKIRTFTEYFSNANVGGVFDLS